MSSVVGVLRTGDCRQDEPCERIIVPFTPDILFCTSSAVLGNLSSDTRIQKVIVLSKCSNGNSSEQKGNILLYYQQKGNGS